MTRARSAVSPATAVETRQSRRTQRRRIAREQWLAVVVLVVAFAVTAVLLGLQWLDGSSSSIPSSLGHLPLIGGPT